MMLDTHFKMEKPLKETFDNIDDILTQQTKDMMSRGFFLPHIKSGKDFQACQNQTATHYACIKAMNALNELDWLCYDGALSSVELKLIESLALSIHTYLSNEDDKPSNAREILLHLNHLKQSVEINSPDVTFNAATSMVWDMIGATSSMVVYGLGFALAAGIATIGLSVVPTIAIGVGMAILGLITSMQALDSLKTHCRLTFNTQFKELDQFADALKQQHELKLDNQAVEVVATDHSPQAVSNR